MFFEWEEEGKQIFGDNQIVAESACSSLKINLSVLWTELDYIFQSPLSWVWPRD